MKRITGILLVILFCLNVCAFPLAHEAGNAAAVPENAGEGCLFEFSDGAWTPDGSRRSLNEYAVRAMIQAQEASGSGTFGVGGLLMDMEGNILCEMHNQVIKGTRVNDPTAHGERQIVDWYFENKEKCGLPEPEQCVLITSLDPCVMCTCALAQAGFDRVIVVALDDYAGINWKGNDDCSALEGTECQKYVKEHFAYPEITGSQSRAAFGADLTDLDLFADCMLTTETLTGCLEAFSLTADAVREKVSSAAVEISQIINPGELDPAHPVREYLSSSFGDDFLACTWKPGGSAEEFLDYIQKKDPEFNGVAYFDLFGNLLLLAEDDEKIPTQSAFMKVTRRYADVRNTEPVEGYEINEYLANPKYGYFLYMTCPEVSTRTVMEIGAIGSTLENTSEHAIMYINGGENEDKINSLIQQLPPLYNENINIRFEKAR